MTAIRLLIVDDHPIMRDGLRGVFSGDPDFEVAGEAADGAEAVRLAQYLEPDVILMDLRMPAMGGVEAITRLRELDHAGYVRTDQAGGDTAQAAVALTREGRAALDHYAAAVRRLPRVDRKDRQPPAPYVRVGDADRDAAAAALGEHFAHGRLTLDELDARLEATLTATTRGELSLAAWDQPDLTVRSARISPGQAPVAGTDSA